MGFSAMVVLFGMSAVAIDRLILAAENSGVPVVTLLFLHERLLTFKIVTTTKGLSSVSLCRYGS